MPEQKQQTENCVRSPDGEGSGWQKKQAATRKAAWRRSEVVCYIAPEKIRPHQYSTIWIIEATSLPFYIVSLTLHDVLSVDHSEFFCSQNKYFYPAVVSSKKQKCVVLLIRSCWKFLKRKLKKDSSSISFPPPLSPSTHKILLMSEHNGERGGLRFPKGGACQLWRGELKVEHSASQGTMLRLSPAQSHTAVVHLVLNDWTYKLRARPHSERKLNKFWKRKKHSFNIK